MTVFDPARFNFVRLNFHFPGEVPVYEYKNHFAVDGNWDALRINLYLSMDDSYVTIWHGLLEPTVTEAEFENGRMASGTKPEGFDFDDYNEVLFRGYVDSDEVARYIFRALRVGEGQRYVLPQMLSRGTDGVLRCDLLQ